MDFITGPKASACFLCEAVKGDPSSDRERYVLARSEQAIAILNRYPYGAGHTLVAPKAHLASLEDLTLPVAADLTALTQRCLRVLKAELRPDGFNLGVNLGKVAGAGVADHVHQHVVPRWEGDTNFMPLLSETRVLNEHLQVTYDRLRAGYERTS
jgi:ATP adenylyltransferase